MSSLRLEIAATVGVEPSHVLVTAGGDDALLRCFLARLSHGRKAVATYPSFEMIPRYAEQVGARLVEVEWWDGPFPIERVLQTAGTDTDIVFVVSPNNPTGAVLEEKDLRRLADSVPLVVLDAAYTEFAEFDLTPVALSLANVVVVRTLSKAWGLAGLRVGYLLGPSSLISEIGSFANPYPVSGLSAAIATKRLQASREITEFVNLVRRQRDSLVDLLRAHQIEALPSQANFVLARFDDAEWVTAVAASLGVGLRRFPDRPGLERHIRMTLPGTHDGFRRLSHVLLSAIAPEALLFDLDGVLADVSRSQVKAILATAESFGVALTRSQVADAQAEGQANDDWALTRYLCASRGTEVSLAEVTKRFETFYQGTTTRSGFKEAETLLVDVPTLSSWAEILPLGVVTGRPRSDAEYFLKRSGLERLVSVMVTRDNAPLKPDPTPVRLAIARLEGSPSLDDRRYTRRY